VKRQPGQSMEEGSRIGMTESKLEVGEVTK
jgi:hypothetical protein